MDEYLENYYDEEGNEPETYFDEDEYQVDFAPYIRALWRKAWIILLVAVVFAAAFVLGCKITSVPVYTSSFATFVCNKEVKEGTTITNSDVNASSALAKTLITVMNGQEVLTEIAEKEDIPYTAEQLKEMISLSFNNNSLLVTTTVTCDDAEMSYRIANALMEVAPSTGKALIEGGTVKVATEPTLPSEPIGNDYKKYLVLGGGIGFVLAFCVILITELMKTRVTDPKELTKRYGVAVIGKTYDSKRDTQATRKG